LKPRRTTDKKANRRTKRKPKEKMDNRIYFNKTMRREKPGLDINENHSKLAKKNKLLPIKFVRQI
jgi:hypothetical protein